MNRSDAERIASVFDRCGYEPAGNIDSADITVVTMCSVRQMATDRVFGLENKFREIKKSNPGLKSVLTGCIVEKDRERFMKIFDHVLDIKTLAQWPSVIGISGETAGKGDYFDIFPKNKSKYSSLIPISKGCDNFCAYCVVPYTRGPLVCRRWKDILCETEKAVRDGAKEIWLLGQNVNNYHSDEVDFAKLLELVNSVPGDFWIRFTSPHPKDFGNRAITAMAKCQKVTPYLNLPIQSGDDRVLKAMRRPYTVAQYSSLVKNLRAAFKKYRRRTEKIIALSTDVIVGFPGETKEQFANTAKTFGRIKYDMAYIAQYSQRAGTASAATKDDVAKKDKKTREVAVNDIVKKTALARNKEFVGKTVQVLVDFGQKRYLRLRKIPPLQNRHV